MLWAAGLQEINPPPAEAADRTSAIIGGRLIDGQGGKPIENAVVVIRGSQIVAVGSKGSTEVPAKATRIDVSGLSVVPGLLDSHFHSVNELDVPRRFLSHGVTAFRDPGHPFRFYQAVKQTGEPMPRVFLTGAHLDSYPPIWPQQAAIIKNAAHARQIVNEHIDRGASAIKIYFRLPIELYEPVCATAHQRGVPVTAHLELIDADDAIRAGLDGVEHVTSLGTALADPQVARDFKETVSENPDMRRDYRYRLWAGLDLERSARVKPLLELLVERKVVMSPTLAVFERRAGDKDVTEMHVRGFEKMLRFVGMCHEEGVTIVAGSHTWVPHAKSGWAYQRELELLVEAGLEPLDAIKAGTVNNARFFRAEDRLGSIRPGKAADMVFVEGDPAQDIMAMYNVRRVMFNGRWIVGGN
jgi:imidazolonepropionase-like amidohydrolase